MAQLARLEFTIQATDGEAVSGASIEVRRQGAQVFGNQAGPNLTTINVDSPGAVVAGDTVAINTGTTTRTVSSITAITVVVGGLGFPSVSDDDRVTIATALPTIYEDAEAATSTPNPLTTNSLGYASCFVTGGKYDVKISGGGQATRLIQDVAAVGGESNRSTVYMSGSATAWIWDTLRAGTEGDKLISIRSAGTEKASVDKDGTGVFPRIGPASTSTTGGALRVVDGNVFPLTVAGVQAALDECKAVGGGTVMVPANAGIQMASTSIKIPNKVTLSGMGSIGGTNFTFVGVAATNVSAIIENELQAGNQQAAAVQNISIDGGKASGATVTTGINFVNLYSGTYVRGVRIINVSGTGAHFNGLSNSSGPYFIQDLTVSDSGLDNILVQHTMTGMRMADIDSEDPGTGYACLRLQSDPTSVGRIILGALLENIYVENSAIDATSYGIVLDGTQECSIVNFGAVTTNAANFGALLRIQKTGSTSPYGNRVSNLWQSGSQVNLIDDNYAGIALTNAKSSVISFYESPTIVSTDAPGYVYGVQMQRVGPNQASTAALTLSRAANFFVVTGTADITSIATIAADAGRIVTLQFSGTAATNGVVDGSNLKLAGNFAYTPDDMLTLMSNGTNWYEIARSVN